MMDNNSLQKVLKKKFGSFMGFLFFLSIVYGTQVIILTPLLQLLEKFLGISREPKGLPPERDRITT